MVELQMLLTPETSLQLRGIFFWLVDWVLGWGLQFFILILYRCFCAWDRAFEFSACRGQERALSGPLQLELQVVAKDLVWVLH